MPQESVKVIRGKLAYPHFGDNSRAVSRENVELVESLQPAGVDLVNLFGHDENVRAWAPADLLAGDFEVRFVSGVQGVEGAYRGLEGFVEGWRDWLAAWATYWVDVEDFVDAGDQIVALLRVRAKTSRDGVLMEHAPAAVWTIEQGKVIGIRLYLERGDALHAAGLSEQETDRVQTDTEALRARYAAISGGDWAAAFRDVHPDFELKTADRVPLAGTYRGAEAATQFLEDLWEPFEEVIIEPEEFFEHDDRIVVFLLVRFRHKGSSAIVENRIGALWTMRDGKPVRCEMFAQREKALKAAGMKD